MTVILAVPHLYDRVTARFALESAVVPMVFGWNAAATQLRSSLRIAWIPGDPGGSLGDTRPPKYVGLGADGRQIATLEERCTVEITAYDPTAPTDERAQYQAARELYDSWLRAVYLEAHGTFRVLSATWIGGARVRRLGATIRVVLAVQAPIPDVPRALEAVDVGALVDVAESDLTESIVVPPP